MSDELKRGVSHGSAIRFLSVQASEAVTIARQRHNLDDAATVVIGKAMIAALMMSAHIKGEERITMQLQCEEPRLSLICDVDANGHIRARLSPTHLRGETELLDGLMLVIKHNASEELYRGITEIKNEGIPQALARHLATSSQVETALRFAVSTAADGTVQAAGLLVERMPSAPGLPSLSPEEFAALYGDLAEADPGPLFTELERGQLRTQDLLPAEIRPVAWRCHCSQHRVEGMLVALGVEELHSMLTEDNGASVTCHFCNLQYTVTGARLAELIASLGVDT